jgi:acyl dehydratase
MSLRTPLVDLHLDDYQPGDRFEGIGITLTESEIIDFAFRYDPQPFHLDIAAAKQSVFGGLSASGFQTLALAFRSVHQVGAVGRANMAGLGMEAIAWPKPTYAGDTIRGVLEVKEVRPSSSKPDRGILKLGLNALNQNGETVLTAVLTIMMRRRAGSSPSA